MQSSELFTIEFLGMNMLQLALYVGVALAIMLVITVIVKSR